MGSACGNSRTKQPDYWISHQQSRDKGFPITEEQLIFKREAHIEIITRNLAGKQIRTDPVTFRFKEPKFSNSTKIFNDKYACQASLCVLPGWDPRLLIAKECQDNWAYFTDGQSILICLYDGHGKLGAEVVEFCVKTTRIYYNNYDYTNNPKQFLTDLLLSVDRQLAESQIEDINSGSTGVLLLLWGHCVYCASVGDSRGIISSMKRPQKLPTVPSQMSPNDRLILGPIRKRRSSCPDIKLVPVQLTKDQKPEDPEETQRIVKSGGRVDKLVDEVGNKVGPYRVWRADENRPGLAMSRSIGDRVGKSLGVIATPVVTEYKLRRFKDFHIVAASDGVWDVMDNEEVTDFVEKHRHLWQKDIDQKVFRGNVTCENSTISQMLWEEARVRWLKIVEEDDVMIDDISCVILEFIHDERPSKVRTILDKQPGKSSLARVPTVLNTSAQVEEDNTPTQIIQNPESFLQTEELQDTSKLDDEAPIQPSAPSNILQ